MLCIIAAEKESADTIKQNLENSGKYPGWQFEIYTSAVELINCSNNDIDIIVISRFLPGDSVNLLKNIRMTFPTAHIVLLAGTDSERQRHYIKNAHRYGLYNIVTGKLPGDGPYTIFDALVSSREPDRDGYYQLSQLEDGESTESYEVAPEPDEKEASVPTQNPMPERELAGESFTERKPDKVEKLETEIARLKQIVEMLGAKEAGQGEAGPKLVSGHRDRGIIVCSAANKGGVGKTTVAVALATALSGAGVSTLIVDYDLGSPNIAGLFGINGVKGIESLAGRHTRQSTLKDLIIKKGYLDILPGVMDKTMPNFRKGQLLEIIDTAAEMYDVVVVDTPPEFWTKTWLEDIFARTEYMLAVTDQSILSECDSENYAPALLAMGATPDKIGIVLNKYSPKLHNPRRVEKIFCAGFKKNVKSLPKIVAVIPENWNEYVQRGYKGEIAGIDDVHSQWHRLAESIAKMAGYNYKKENKRLSIKDRLLKKLEKAT